ncbi:mediator of RNA polymerase II transcription subunit 7-A-like [Lytechinus variegatus]|uniref:mediator of RNA polymerase II transcription subunit 7-A-like n=1 Tax=Lytechinus variegatus TaxID=7654 RepID=UPI001BB11CE7|nr:mediator of RNA polymerase II transcription subunit 7-A-like [Lytechinus variegatus]
MNEPQGVSSLPLPPMMYIANYTDERVLNKTTPKPPLPVQEAYGMFGATFVSNDDIIRPLESQGLKRLHPQRFDHKKELKKINHSILVNFLDLIDTLIVCPNGPRREEKLDDMNLLFIHMHHLINEFRPHQARETLRVMMEVQKRQRLDTAERFQKHLEKVTEILQGCFMSLPDNVENIDSKVAVKIEPEAAEMMARVKGDDVVVKREVEDKVEKEKNEGSRYKDKLMCDLIDAL